MKGPEENTMTLFYRVCNACSRITTESYSTSFSSAIRLLHKDLQMPVHNVYGFVRFADEIVDTFHSYNKAQLLAEFKEETFKALERRISLNPILQSFQETVNEYGITTDLIKAFFTSMEMDLERTAYNQSNYTKYIYGSAEVVGLMCLHIFCNGNKEEYYRLKPYACSLGAAFQKVNFLRDMKADYNDLKRVYFPGCDFTNFSSPDKALIEDDIQSDFDKALEGITQLPLKARFGVYVAYKYYLTLFRKIKRLQPQKILESRIRIPDYGKAMILAKATVRSRFNLL